MTARPLCTGPFAAVILPLPPMFPSTPTLLVRALEARLGSRSAVREVLALASAAVLVAFPYDHRADYLKGLDARLPKIRRLGRRSLDESGGVDDARRTETLAYLLHGLEELHHGDREAILGGLEAASAIALEERPAEFDDFRRDLRAAHDTFLEARLSARLDLN